MDAHVYCNCVAELADDGDYVAVVLVACTRDLSDPCASAGRIDPAAYVRMRNRAMISSAYADTHRPKTCNLKAIECNDRLDRAPLTLAERRFGIGAQTTQQRTNRNYESKI